MFNYLFANNAIKFPRGLLIASWQMLRCPPRNLYPSSTMRYIDWYTDSPVWVDLSMFFCNHPTGCNCGWIPTKFCMEIWTGSKWKIFVRTFYGRWDGAKIENVPKFPVDFHVTIILVNRCLIFHGIKVKDKTEIR